MGAGRAIDEHLVVLDEAAFGETTEVIPKFEFVLPCDPAAPWRGAHGGHAFFAYSTNFLVDIENAIIVDVEATTAIRQAEVLAGRRKIELSRTVRPLGAPAVRLVRGHRIGSSPARDAFYSSNQGDAYLSPHRQLAS